MSDGLASGELETDATRMLLPSRIGPFLRIDCRCMRRMVE
jgi:hypothetical protein